MDMMPVENSTEVQLSSDVMDHHTEDLNPQLLNHGDEEIKSEITEEEVRGILDVIAATGKFWHDWDTLKTLLSFRLKQVMAEYPEAQMVTDQQTAALGETHAELVKRLDEALLSFIEGPPFTLQRLCEILLAARSIYPNLSKLALALEKNLLVTSTLTVSTDPYPPTIMPKPDEHEKGSVVSSTPSAPLQNGVEAVVVDQDEEMTDAEEIDEDKVVEDSKGSDKVIVKETINGTSETSLDQSINAEPSSDQSINVEPSSDQNINAEPSPKQSNNAEPSSDHSNNSEPSANPSNNSEPSANPSNNSEPSGESSLSSEQLDSASQ